MGHGRQVGGAQHASQQAEAKQHHTGGGAAEHGVLQGGLAAGATMAEDAGQHVAWHARHFDAQKDHQDVIGRDHDAQADRRAQDHHVELRGVVVVGHARDPCEIDEQHREEHQQAPNDDAEAVQDQQAGENLLRSGRHGKLLARTDLRPGGHVEAQEPQRGHGPQEGDPIGQCGRLPRGEDHADQQHQHDRGHQRQLRGHRVERRAEVLQNILNQFVQIHGDALATGVMAGEGAGGGEQGARSREQDLVSVAAGARGAADTLACGFASSAGAVSSK